MPRRRNETSQQRRLRFEQFEKRLVMSAQAVASVLPELESLAPEVTQEVFSLADASTQAANIAAEYGFDGAGQTVVVIDSGIAFDHYALGGGFGEGYRVVGGYDFAENDDNPYDDGPAGFHGTHVAGIIGSTDEQYQGVSSGVDLVSLRVFDDNGFGDLAWVEQALQWVHENKDSFANPITTVNLSLGTNWNADTVPEWATLEDEFAQLEADGLFISVAAGNAFSSFGETGLSYPAVSEFVVPVASHGADGNLSDFSQRDDRVLVAPGESIRSTVPAHLFGGASQGNFVGSSGTSQAAPYVAGASAILRQANEFAGVTNITQDLLYQQFLDTADQIYDSVTDGYYHRINLEAALESVIQDLHSGTAETATDIGLLSGGETIEGTIGKIADVDAFEFTAEHTGRVTLNFEVTDDLVPHVDIVGIDAETAGNEVTFDVVAGQKYNFAVATADGSGHYKISFHNEVAIAEQAPPTDLGTVTSSEFLNQSVDGEATFEITAGRNGLLTVISSGAVNDTLAVEIYDSQMNQVQSTTSVNGEVRLDIGAEEGETFFLKVIGESDSFDLEVHNLVSLDDGDLTVNGTDADDLISVSADDGFFVAVNGVEYSFSNSEVSNITVVGHQGNDAVELTLGADNDQVDIATDGVSVTNRRFNLDATDFKSISVSGGGGFDFVSLSGSEGDDQLASGPTGLDSTTGYSLSGADFQNSVSGFELVHFRSSGGHDVASLEGTAGNDLFASLDGRNWLQTGRSWLVIDGYDAVSFDGGGGNDRAYLYDSTDDDHFVLRSDQATLTNDAYSVTINNISQVNAYSTSGSDSVQIYDTAGDETFNHRDGVSTLTGDGYQLYARGFADVDVHSVGGNDLAEIYDTAGNDTFYSNGGDTELVSKDLSVTTTGFKQVDVIANKGGFDRAFLNGTDGDDVVLADRDSSTLTLANGQSSRVVGFDQTNVDTKGGIDFSYITGSEEREKLTASYSQVELETTLQLLRMTNVEHTRFDGNGGGDTVDFEDLDLLESLGSQATAYLRDHTVVAEEFSLLEANSVDNAIAQYDIEAVDYLYLLRGQWRRK